MASAWGQAWGSAFGSAWGTTAQVVPKPVGGISRLRDDFEVFRRKKRLEEELERRLAELRDIEKKKAAAQKKAAKADPPKGILAKLHKLEVREERVQEKIQVLEMKIEGLEAAIQAFAIEQDDEDILILL